MDLSPFITVSEADNSTVSATFDEAAWRKAFMAERARLTKRGMQQRAENGLHVSRVPIGYRRVAKDGSLMLELDPETAPKVRRLFERAAKRQTAIRQLAKEASKIGLVTKNGACLSPSSVHHLLTNPFYTGVVEWAGSVSVGKHPAIVSGRLFATVQEGLKTRQRTSTLLQTAAN